MLRSLSFALLVAFTAGCATSPSPAAPTEDLGLRVGDLRWTPLAGNAPWIACDFFLDRSLFHNDISGNDADYASFRWQVPLDAFHDGEWSFVNVYLIENSTLKRQVVSIYTGPFGGNTMTTTASQGEGPVHVLLVAGTDKPNVNTTFAWGPVDSERKLPEGTGERSTSCQTGEGALVHDYWARSPTDLRSHAVEISNGGSAGQRTVVARSELQQPSIFDEVTTVSQSPALPDWKLETILDGHPLPLRTAQYSPTKPAPTFVTSAHFRSSAVSRLTITNPSEGLPAVRYYSTAVPFDPKIAGWDLPLDAH